MLDDINSTVGGVKTISEGADQCETSKNAVVDTMSALSAISEENAASAEETTASTAELNDLISSLSADAEELTAIATELTEQVALFH